MFKDSIKLKVLICEADLLDLSHLESLVKPLSKEVYISDDAVKATHIFEEINPDILLVSQNLQGADSMTFIESIREKKPSQIIVFMTTNETSDVEFRRSIDLQVNKYLNMPVNESSLGHVFELLSQKKMWENEFRIQNKILEDYKEAIDKSFSVSKHDKDGKIFYVNQSFCDITELSYDEAMKGSINPLRNDNGDMEFVWRELREKKIYRDRQVFKFDDKQDHIIDVTAVAISNEEEEIEEFLLFNNDVTEVVNTARKIKEQEIDKKLQKLEHVKELNKIKDSFLTVFSHELKTPLNSIINFSQYIKKHLLKQELKKKDILIDQISQINISGWNMLSMIENLLDCTRLRDGDLELVKSEVSLNVLIEDVLLKYSNDLRDKEVMKLFENDCIIMGDKKRVSQIIDNIISNSIKYCKSKISIVLKSNDKKFVLEIVDDGEGFSDTDKVFELFSQSGEDNITRTAQGTGVGLFVIKKLCDAMNYTISIGNSKNLGGARIVIKGSKT